jgi:hypothetical protein
MVFDIEIEKAIAETKIRLKALKIIKKNKKKEYKIEKRICGGKVTINLTTLEELMKKNHSE